MRRSGGRHIDVRAASLSTLCNRRTARRQCGLARTGALATSSANRTGAPPASDATTVRATLGAGLALLLAGGALPPSAPSTVVDASGRQPAILRHGAIPDDAISRVISD